MKFSIRIHIILLFSLVLFSCKEKNNSVEESSVIYIISDYLTENDTILFKDFCKEYKASVRIQGMTTDQIVGQFRNKGYNSGFDIVMLRSLCSVNELSRHNLLHPVDQYLSEKELNSKFNSAKYNFIGLGFDPYLYSYHQDSTLAVRTYSDLKNQDFFCTLDDADLVPFFASLMPKLQRVGTYNWIKDFYKHKKTFDPIQDTLPNMICFTTSSVHQGVSKDSSYNKSFNETYLPNQNGEGAFYDMCTAAIVYQAEHFQLSQRFIEFYLQDKNNAVLNEELGSLPLHHSKKIRLYRVRPDELVQYYTTIDRIINKLR